MKAYLLKLGMSLFLILFSFQSFALTTKGNQIVDSKGDPVDMKGINWFGFNNGQTAPDGLWGGPDSVAFDFATIVHRLQLLGFNAVRLPFSFKDLQLPPKNFAQPCKISSTAEIQQSVTNPKVQPGDKALPPQPFPPSRKAGMCNDYLPNDTTFNRYVWMVNFFAQNGFYALVDNHLREDPTAVEDQKKWVDEWVKLATAISKQPNVKDHVMFDILNEPDKEGIRWEASGNKPGLKDLYLSAMDAIYKVYPDALFFLEGSGQGGLANWGDGFVTDPAILKSHGASDPNPFFQALLQKPYLNQVVISPHVYPPSVTGSPATDRGAALFKRLSDSFGYLNDKGYCNGGKCKVFPIAVGEFGSKFETEPDIVTMGDMAQYFNNVGPAVDGKHQPVKNWFYWVWNNNSPDSGGLLADDWRAITWDKVDYLTQLGLTPWYLGGGVNPTKEATYGSLCVSVKSAEGLSADQLKALNVGGYVLTIKDLDTPICEKVTTGSYTVGAPDIISGDQKFSAESQVVTVAENKTATAELVYKATTITPPPPVEEDEPPPPVEPPSNDGNPYSVAVQAGKGWDEGSGIYGNTINFYVTNKSSELISAPWTIEVSNSSYLNVGGAWNFTITSSEGGTITGTSSSEEWQNLLPNGGNAINVGFSVSSNSNNFVPTTVKINGQPATIKVNP